MKFSSKKNSVSRSQGFTLIETLVYLGLFAILIGGAFTAAYAIVESSGRAQTRTMIQEEGDFLIAKITWSLSGVQVINQPSVGTPGSVLSFNKVTGLDASNQPIVAPVSIGLVGSDLQVSYPSNPTPNTFMLNNDNVAISNLVFTHDSISGNSIKPESLESAFTVSARTPNGDLVTQDFSTTIYLKK
jgi:type II secretory pathway pseudopilin PulG